MFQLNNGDDADWSREKLRGTGVVVTDREGKDEGRKVIEASGEKGASDGLC